MPWLHYEPTLVVPPTMYALIISQGDAVYVNQTQRSCHGLPQGGVVVQETIKKRFLDICFFLLLLTRSDYKLEGYSQSHTTSNTTCLLE